MTTFQRASRRFLFVASMAIGVVVVRAPVAQATKYWKNPITAMLSVGCATLLLR
jgi:hypothetical protein